MRGIRQSSAVAVEASRQPPQFVSINFLQIVFLWPFVEFIAEVVACCLLLLTTSCLLKTSNVVPVVVGHDK